MRFRLVAALFTTALLLAGCSAGGDSEGASTTTEPTEDFDATTTTDGGGGDDDATTTTEADGPDSGDEVTAEDLAGLFPPASKLGEGWEEVDSEPDDGSGEAIVKKQCPEAAALNKGSDRDDSDDAVRTYEDEDGRQLEITFSDNADDVSYTDEDLAAYTEALTECELVIENRTIGFQAAVDEEHGEQGFQLMQINHVKVPDGPQVELRIYGYIWRYGNIGVEISGTDGVDPSSYEVSKFDTDLLDQLALQLDGATSELGG
jgi:hypothetical protein